MHRGLHEIVGAIGRWREDAARARVTRWRGRADVGGDDEVTVAERHAGLCRDEAWELLGAAAREGAASLEVLGATRAHLADAMLERALAPHRRALRALGSERDVLDLGAERATGRGAMAAALDVGPRARRLAATRALDAALEATAEAALDAAARVRERLDARARETDVVLRTAAPAVAPLVPTPRAGRDPNAADGDGAALANEARVFLDGTDAAYREALRGALERFGSSAGRHDVTLAALIETLRAPTLDGLFPRRARWRRAADLWATLRFERELQGSLRSEAATCELSPRARVAAVRPPVELRLAASPVELGLVSELSAAEATARAVAMAACAAALPAVFAHPVEATAARAFGALALQRFADPGSCRRTLGGAGGDDVQRAAQLTSLAYLFELREAAGVVCASASGGLRALDRVEHEAFAATGVSLPPGYLTLRWRVPSALGAWCLHPGARYRALRGGLVLWARLRDRFDEDWYRNPRSAEAVRAGGSRGGALSVEGWLDELGSPTRQAIELDGDEEFGDRASDVERGLALAGQAARRAVELLAG